ncbi:MAG: UvrABC system protein C [Candidatus Anoxychlamydiales bacterium]|nr:UvrABC system protein C [Candidatus Anoxychlamydiales bacterium]NGX35247.1 UvrABC system protein C [Candidatus Anoxychlamydiales bacterium]
MIDSIVLKKLPSKFGVYIMKDINGKILYVGKAKNLKNRIKQYFLGKDTRASVSFLVDQIESIETMIVSNDKEALILENTLIKKHQPKYNILLKDDKTYVSIMINTSHTWPMIKLIRLKGQPKDKNLYFGPYTNVKAARAILNLLYKLFPLRQCSDSELQNRSRPCILYDIKKCIAPCVNKCTKKEYNTLVEKVISFLKGKDKSIIKDLHKKMKIASKNLEYEKADINLSLIKQIKHIMLEQFVDILSTKNSDVIGFYQSKHSLMIVKLIFITGRLTQSEHFSFFEIATPIDEIIESFVLQHYLKKPTTAKEIIVPIKFSHLKNIEAILQKHIKNLKIIYPIKGKKKELIKLANENAKSLLLQEKNLKSLKEKELLELQSILHLTNFPSHIVCFDTSNISGTTPVGGMTTFIDGIKDRSKTKLFKIKTEKKGDIAAFDEILYRHFSKLKTFPDLLILDGGKQQLNIALKVLDKLKIASIDVIALTKEKAKHTKSLTKERVFIPHSKDPIIINPQSPTLFLLQQIRDEAHRIAISFHKKSRAKKTITTSLFKIPGIGPKKTKTLLKAFKSVKNLKKAKREDLEKLGILNSKDIDKIISF